MWLKSSQWFPKAIQMKCKLIAINLQGTMQSDLCLFLTTFSCFHFAPHQPLRSKTQAHSSLKAFAGTVCPA